VVRRSPPFLLLALITVFAGFLYLARLHAAGLLGPDEARYAAVARQMARSGDWVTPRLWGESWFEKPALLYWMSAAGFRLGLGPELAPRLPVAFLSLAYLGFYWWILRREFGPRSAFYATLVLGTSVGWFGFSQVGVTDLPMTAAFSAAMLVALPWVAKGDARVLPLVAALLGLAVLAKGLVPLVLAAPLAIAPVLSGTSERLRHLLRPRVMAAFLVVALPWYVLCYLRNGRQFLDVFFWQHQFERFRSPALLHTQPWWFYIPVLLVGMLPWTPLVAVGSPRGAWQDPRRRFLLTWILFGLLFFSLAVNKLPGYMLPLLPALCALVGIGLAESEESKFAIVSALAGSALLLVLFPIANQILPQAVAVGLSRAAELRFEWSWLCPPIVAVLVWVLARRGKHSAAIAFIALSAASGYLYLKFATLPRIDAAASARSLWQEIAPQRADICIDSLNRSFRYGLNYYSDTPLPDCSAQPSTNPKPLAIRQTAGHPPSVVPSPRK
jgi:4-amino-4-deoxy-L-arabinose transferase-like glycosyltransferase